MCHQHPTRYLCALVNTAVISWTIICDVLNSTALVPCKKHFERRVFSFKDVDPLKE